MRRSAMRRTISVIAILVIAAGQMIAWPPIQVRMALAANARVCLMERSECGCCHEEDSTASVDRKDDGTEQNCPLGNECDCRQCFCKVFPSSTFLTAAGGASISLPDCLFFCEVNLDLPAVGFSRSLFHPPRV